jgi:spore maturation protein CgeB
MTMRIVFYTHSLVSDWNHGNAHFLRGVMRALIARGHDALALEPEDGWSRSNLRARQGPAAEAAFHRAFPDLVSRSYGPDFDHAAALADADVVIVHEWTDPGLVRRIGRLRRAARFTLLFHDTHHRAVSAEAEIAGLALEDYDGVLAFGDALRERYVMRGWGRRAFTWHEAADTSVFRPLDRPIEGDLAWVGNWGDGERTAELDRFLIEPARRLGLRGTVRGVRYPEDALRRLREAGLAYGGWIANAAAPALFAAHRATVHVPRRAYVEALRGIPTIRPFEALACGVPLVSAPWDDVEGLFRPGVDLLFARDADSMTERLRDVLQDPALARALRENGLSTIRSRHTCGHRVEELLGIVAQIGPRRMEAAE